jgi:glycosyltransferase involved in cell wall biosynthesis
MSFEAKLPPQTLVLLERVHKGLKEWRFRSTIKRLRGGVTVHEAEYLRSLIRSCVAGARVEVGSFRGKSAVALCEGLPASGINGEPMLYCVEPHRPFIGFYGGKFGPEDRGAFFRVMLKTKAYRRVALINSSSEVLSPGWREPVGFLFLDGDHTYAGVKRDFESWRGHLLTGALVAFDDSTNVECGPYQLIEELLAEGAYEIVGRTGKITTLRRKPWSGVPPLPSAETPLRILVFCDRMVLTGGLLRFEKVGRELIRLGHEVVFCTLSDELPENWAGKIPVLRFSEAWYRQWDVTMCPGAGILRAIPESVLVAFRDTRFGLRIQHILNDRSKRDAFLRVNAQLSPHVVVFNNEDWPAGSFNDFAGNSFHRLLGACDTTLFSPGENAPAPPSSWVIGGQTRKNPAVLIAALRLLPERFVLRLFGPSNALQDAHADLIAAQRLQFAGELVDEELVRYYRGLDCFVSPETAAGWSNASAEAMATGVPAICTAAGTTAFAEHEVSALLLESASAEEIAAKIKALEASPEVHQRLAKAGRESISRFSWTNYARELLELCRAGRESQYFHLPELGVFGKWPAESRLSGLEPILSIVACQTVLDLGAAEGWIAFSMLKAGAKLVHGFELDADRVRTANTLCEAYPGTQFRTANLSDWNGVLQNYAGEFLTSYDVVLYLGVHHHLSAEGRVAAFDGALALARRYFVIRTSPKLYEEDQLAAKIAAAGFRALQSQSADATSTLGAIWLFEHSAPAQP